MRVPSSLFLGLATSLILLGACQANPGTGPRPTGPGTSNQVITLQADTLTAELSGASETPAVASQAHGYGIFQLNQAKDTLIARVYVAGLSGPITGAHLHLGLAGKSGEVVEPLAVTGNVLTGTWKRSDAEQPLSEARVKSLLNGELYVNVHTEKFPGGEIRG
ncbi:MAG: CHRD domain-containing protein, partial [Candidatus Sericytochromatia bacterium]